MARRDKELRKELDALLEARPHWALEMQSSPGAPATWCFRPNAEPGLSVSVDGGALWIYLIDIEQDRSVPDIATLTAWLDENEPLFVGRRGLSTEDFRRELQTLAERWRHGEL
jgi:hypothetical protein